MIEPAAPCFFRPHYLQTPATICICIQLHEQDGSTLLLSYTMNPQHACQRAMFQSYTRGGITSYYCQLQLIHTCHDSCLQRYIAGLLLYLPFHSIYIHACSGFYPLKPWMHGYIAGLLHLPSFRQWFHSISYIHESSVIFPSSSRRHGFITSQFKHDEKRIYSRNA